MLPPLSKTICSECEILEKRLDAATDSIVEIVNKVFTIAEQKSHKLDEALDARDHVLRDYLQHLDDHSYTTAA